MLQQVIRIVNVVAFWPIMARTGEGATPTAALITAWAGLRGLVGLVLALLVLLDPGLGGAVAGAAYRERAFFFVASTVVLTVVIQGTAFEPLLKVRQDLCGPFDESESSQQCAFSFFAATTHLAVVLFRVL